MAEQFTKTELKEALPEDVWNDVADYIEEIDARRKEVLPIGFGTGVRRIPHC